MSEETPTQTPQRFGDFEILRELGRGGMGIVYEARQRSLNRKVALKIMAGKLGLTSTARVRFQREAEAAARLHHTNIVAVHATGEEDGTPYYAMELIEGPSLGQVIASMREAKQQPVAGAQGSDPSRAQPVAGDPNRERKRPVSPDAGDLPAWVGETITYKPGSPRNAGALPKPAGAMAKRSAAMPGPEVQKTATLTGDSSSMLRSGGNYFDTAANMIAAVADALDYAHNHGVIHRDIKPSNLLLSPDGRLSVTDFGLARMLEQPGMTLTGEFVGSPLYMSPEQIAAGRMKLDHRTDVYSLGATLYQLLTLQPPFPGQGRDEIIAQILMKEPRRLRQIDKRIPTDLETICLKALEKDPDRRYQTAAQLAEDLRRYANRFAIAAKRTGPIGRTVRWVRRHPAVAALTLCVMIVAAAAGFFADRARVLQRQQALGAALRAVAAIDPAAFENTVPQLKAARVPEAEILVLRGWLAWNQTQPDDAIPHLEHALVLMPDSLAARAILGWAYGQSRQPLERRPPQEDLDVVGLEPLTALDYLAKGMAEAATAPGHGLNSLDEASRLLGESGAVRLWYAIAYAFRAEDTEDIQDVKTSLEQTAVTKILSGLDVRLFAHVVAAYVFEKHGQRSERERLLQQLDEVVTDLKRSDKSGMAAKHQHLKWYYQLKGHSGAALDEWRKGTQGPGGFPHVAACCAALPYEAGLAHDAVETLDRLCPPGFNVVADTVRAYCLAELEDGYERALEATQQAVKDHPASLSPQSVLRLLGLKPRAEEASRKVRRAVGEKNGTKSLHRALRWPETWRDAVLNYNCGDITGDALINAAGSHRRRQSIAHQHIALTLLADGDREGAKKRFQQAVDMHVYTHAGFVWGYDWSRAFLNRMVDDPTWPPWIPLKASASTRPARQ